MNGSGIVREGGVGPSLGSVKLISWNVNGLRAVLRKNFLDYLAEENPDILCLQETKARPEEVESLWPSFYQTHWCSAEKRGYSGTAIFTRKPPIKVSRGLGRAEHDREGRVLTAEFEGFFLVNVYVPNSKRDLSRLEYRQRWDRDFLGFVKRLEWRKPVIYCGDFNVAHQERDLANPKANRGHHGFTDEERAGFDAMVRAGFVDTFREYEKGGDHYTWWSLMTGARARNIGWRLDYVLASSAVAARATGCVVQADVGTSDHAPVVLTTTDGAR